MSPKSYYRGQMHAEMHEFAIINYYGGGLPFILFHGFVPFHDTLTPCLSNSVFITINLIVVSKNILHTCSWLWIGQIQGKGSENHSKDDVDKQVKQIAPQPKCKPFVVQ